MDFTGTHPTEDEVERIRLLLSTYQDGGGQRLKKYPASTLPDWRDFERSVAAAMSGAGGEDKNFYDVVVTTDHSTFGISCKMRAELGSALRRQIVYVEVSNAAGDFWEAVGNAGISNGLEMREKPALAGAAIIDLVESWHAQPDINPEKSYYLVCQYRLKPLQYQLFQLPLDLPEPNDLQWDVRVGKKKKGGLTYTLRGLKGGRPIIEWYANSGGQLKYYPNTTDAVWKSDIFTLEPIPDTEDGYGIINKARTYFPDQWGAVGF